MLPLILRLSQWRGPLLRHAEILDVRRTSHLQKSVQVNPRLFSNLRLNQKGRSEILRRVNREELLEGRVRRLGRDEEADREREARAIKRELFCSPRFPVSPSRTGTSPIGHGGDPDLELACAELEAAISKIPANRGRVMKNNKGATGGTQRFQSKSNFGRSMEDLFGHSWRADRGACWIWVPKPATLGEQGYQARSEEIRREGSPRD